VWVGRGYGAHAIRGERGANGIPRPAIMVLKVVEEPLAALRVLVQPRIPPASRPQQNIGHGLVSLARCQNVYLLEGTKLDSSDAIEVHARAGEL
jgi:hypothetical protein